MARRKASHRTPRALLAQHTALAVSPVPSGAGFLCLSRLPNHRFNSRAGRSAGRSTKAAQSAPIKKPRRRQGLSRNASGSLSSFRPRKWCPALLTRTDHTVGGKGEARSGRRSANWHSTGTPRGGASCCRQGRNGITFRAIGPCVCSWVCVPIGVSGARMRPGLENLLGCRRGALVRPAPPPRS